MGDEVRDVLIATVVQWVLDKGDKYLWKLQALPASEHREMGTEFVLKTDPDHQRFLDALAEARAKEDMAVDIQERYTTVHPSMSPEQRKIILLTAQYRAAYGQAFQDKLMLREATNPMYSFTRVGAEYNTYYETLVRQFERVRSETYPGRDRILESVKRLAARAELEGPDCGDGIIRTIGAVPSIELTVKGVLPYRDSGSLPQKLVDAITLQWSAIPRAHDSGEMQKCPICGQMIKACNFSQHLKNEVTRNMRSEAVMPARQQEETKRESIVDCVVHLPGRDVMLQMPMNPAYTTPCQYKEELVVLVKEEAVKHYRIRIDGVFRKEDDTLGDAPIGKIELLPKTRGGRKK